MPRFRAMSPVRIELGVHLTGLFRLGVVGLGTVTRARALAVALA